MSTMKDNLKSKIRSSAHSQLIDPTLQGQQSDVNVNGDVNVNVDVNDFEKAVEQPKKKKPKFEELHTRHTIYIRNDIGEKLDELCGGERGEKTRIINEALEKYLSSKKNIRG